MVCLIVFFGKKEISVAEKFYRFLRAFVENMVEKLKRARNVYKLFTANT